MKILYVTSQFPPFLGGVSLATHRVATGFQQRGHSVTVIARDKSRAAIDEPIQIKVEEQSEVPCYTIPDAGITRIGIHRCLFELKQLVLDIKPDIVHSYYSSMMGYTGKYCAGLANVPHVLSCRGNDMTKNALFKTAMNRLALESADCVTGVSRSMLRWSEAIANLKRSEFVPNSISHEFMEQANLSRAKARDIYQVEQDELVLGMIYRDDWKKGGEYIRAILPILRDSSIKKLKFILVSDEPPEKIKRLEEMFTDNPNKHRRLIHQSNITREQIPSFYRALDLFVLTSKREGMPNTVLEAMACGAPVAATAVDGVVDLLASSKSGLLLDPFNPEQAAEMIIELLKNKNQLKSYQTQGPQLIRDQYMIDTELDHLQSIYDSLIKQKKQTSYAGMKNDYQTYLPQKARKVS